MAPIAETVTIPRKELERLKKDLKRARDEAAVLAMVVEAERDLREGRFVEADSVEEALEKYRAGKFGRNQ